MLYFEERSFHRTVTCVCQRSHQFLIFGRGADRPHADMYPFGPYVIRWPKFVKGH